jgi:hypothetical protein
VRPNSARLFSVLQRHGTEPADPLAGGDHAAAHEAMIGPSEEKQRVTPIFFRHIHLIDIVRRHWLTILFRITETPLETFTSHLKSTRSTEQNITTRRLRWRTRGEIKIIDAIIINQIVLVHEKLN